MKVNAYVLAGDPDYVGHSIRSYYQFVDKIFVSYDENGRSWTGLSLPVDECLKKAKAVDKDSKMVFVGGNFARLDHAPLENETYQRQCVLKLASIGAKWVLQLDTDEVLGNARVFQKCIQKADAAGYKALDFPARWIYRQLGRSRYLEWCNRFWGISAGYPGPVAVKSGVDLVWGRQCESESFRVDFRAVNTGDKLLAGRPVHHVISERDGIYHFSWTRDEESLLAKFKSWGHAKDKDWMPEYERWKWCGKYLYAAVLRSPLTRGEVMGKHLRIVNVPGTNFEER